MSDSPRRRRIDHQRWRRLVEERAYRDVWLAIISVIVILALMNAQHAIDQIQQSRIAYCQSQNQRHDRTIAELDRELARAMRHATTARRAQMAASRAYTIALIDQLAPRQNCSAIVAQ